MDNLFRHIYQELRQPLQSVMQVLIIFLSLYVVFGMLSSPFLLEKNYLPTLLMGLSYAVLSLSLTHLFQEDFADGTLEWHLSQERSIEGYVIQKIIAHWLRFGLSLTLLIGILTSFNSLPLLIGVALTTLTLTLTGAIGSALCLTIPSGSFLLLPLLTLPIGIPMMIVNMGFIMESTASISSYSSLQAGLFCMACSLSFVACPYALRLSLR